MLQTVLQTILRTVLQTRQWWHARRRGTAAVALIATVAAWLAACEIAPGPLGGLQIRPLPAPEPVKIGVTVIDGRTLCLIDVNGDDVPDLCLDPRTGQLFWVRPPTVYELPGGGHDTVEPWVPGVPGVPNPFLPNMAGAFGTDEFAWVESHVDWHAGFEPPHPFDFGAQSAEAWLAAVGLDIEPGTVAVTHALDLHFLDTESWHAEGWIYWSGAFEFPRIGDYDLQQEMWALESEQAGAPMFVAMHVAGDLPEIARLVASMGGESYALDYDGSEWSVVIDDDVTASVYQDGVWIMTVPLE